jgi:hypothetical protein
MKVKTYEYEDQGVYWEALAIQVEKGERLAVYKASIIPACKAFSSYNDVEIKIMYKENPNSSTASVLYYKKLKYWEIDNCWPTKVNINTEYSKVGQYILQCIFYNETKASIRNKASWDWEWNVFRGGGSGEKPIQPPKQPGPFDDIIESLKQLFIVALVLLGLWLALTFKVPQKIAEALKRKGG